MKGWSCSHPCCFAALLFLTVVFLQVRLTNPQSCNPQWALTKPFIASGFNNGSSNGSGINQLAYTATFGNGVSGTISLEDAQPYRTAGLVNTSTNFIAPFQANTLPTGAYGVGSFAGNAAIGDHVPDVVGNLRLDQAWGTLHFAAAAHEVHGSYFVATPGTNGGSMTFATAQVGTKTSWTPVKDLTFSAEFIYSRLINNLNGTFITASGVPGTATGTAYTLSNQNVYNGAVQVLRSF